MDLYHLRQVLHVIATSWDYHGGAESRVSVCGNSVCFIGPTRSWLTCCPAPPLSSSESEQPWSPPPCSAGRAHQSCFCPNSGHKLNPRWVLEPPLPSPHLFRPPPHRNPAIPADSRGHGLHCVVKNISRGLNANQGHCCEEWKVSRAVLTDRFLVSFRIDPVPCKIHIKSHKNKKM
jgi:hypothetical protein